MKPRELALPGEHVLATLYAEHECLLGFLDALRVHVRGIEGAQAPIAPREAEPVIELARTLLGADPHHRREEEVLFPMLEERGLFGPPRRMRFEHEELRALKARLLELAIDLPKGAGETARAFVGVAHTLSALLREHIQREDEVLYPVSLEFIEESKWKAMKEQCDRIGYCSFTPKA
jgi:hemerythrin-like domain-containing protein